MATARTIVQLPTLVAPANLHLGRLQAPWLGVVAQFDEMIPVKLANSLAKHLKINRDKFWQDADAVASQVTAQLKLRQPS